MLPKEIRSLERPINAAAVVRLFPKSDLGTVVGGLRAKRQAALARAAFETESIFIAKTVLLEIDGVLRRVYQLDAQVVRQSLLSLLGPENVTVEDAESVRRAKRAGAAAVSPLPL